MTGWTVIRTLGWILAVACVLGGLSWIQMAATEYSYANLVSALCFLVGLAMVLIGLGIGAAMVVTPWT